MSLLEMEDVTGGYGQVKVLHGIDVTIEEGQVGVILGANGAGKTTTLRAICGMLAAKGRVTFDGTSLLGKRPEVVARSGIAHVPQGRGTFTELTVDENLRLGAINRKDKEVRADIGSWYEAFPRLGERREQAAGSMSGGEQQMLAIARAMMSRPKLLLLDEPSLGLAPLITQELFKRLGEINRETGLTMLIVEQNANLALAIGHHGYVLEAGRIVVSGSAAELNSNDDVRKAYLGF
jgi:branched-chain amino acid transport system ATP-binding protein